ncbi:hypothetical protein JXQ31_13455 [candidate division KSB1 bacterium]|nr:hypothetical protein [candidate division KSB1 bacterium]
MKKAKIIIMVFLLTGMVFSAVNWKTFQAKNFNIQFKVPEDWTTETDHDEDVPSLLSTSPDEDMALMVYAYKDSTLSTEELFDQAVENLNMELDGDAEETEINGMQAWLGGGAGKIDDQVVGIVIMAATYNENNYIVYIFTETDVFEDNTDLMEEIINSFSPIEE